MSNRCFYILNDDENLRIRTGQVDDSGEIFGVNPERILFKHSLKMEVDKVRKQLQKEKDKKTKLFGHTPIEFIDALIIAYTPHRKDGKFDAKRDMQIALGQVRNELESFKILISMLIKHLTIGIDIPIKGDNCAAIVTWYADGKYTVIESTSKRERVEELYNLKRFIEAEYYAEK